MNRFTITLFVILGASLIVNAMALERMVRGDAPVAPTLRTPLSEPARSPGDAPLPPAYGADKLDRVIHELAELRRDVAALQTGAGTAVRTESAAPPPLSPVRRDPAIAEILAEQDLLTAFWTDLGKISGARQRIDDAAYRQAVIAVTADYLELDDAGRGRFSETVHAVWSDAEAAQRDLTEGQKTLVHDPKDPKVYQAAWAALYGRYQERVNLVKERMKTALDTDESRQRQLSSQLDSWVGYITPKQGGHGHGYSEVLRSR